MLPATVALPTLRDDLTFTKSRLAADPRAASQTKPVASLLGGWDAVHAEQLARWDAQAEAEARIAAADDALDDFIVAFAGRVRALPGGEKSDLWATYFKRPPHKLAAPVLGAELDAVRRWQKLLAKDKEPTLVAVKKQLDALVADADAAVAAQTDADAANEHFRNRGSLAAYLTKVRQTRDAVAAALDGLAAKDTSLPRGYSSRFFRRRTVKISAEEKQAKAAKREAERKAKEDAEALVKAAQAKVKAAIQELRAAQKKRAPARAPSAG
jgi:hypothetical protein